MNVLSDVTLAQAVGFERREFFRRAALPPVLGHMAADALLSAAMRCYAQADEQEAASKGASRARYMRMWGDRIAVGRV